MGTAAASAYFSTMNQAPAANGTGHILDHNDIYQIILSNDNAISTPSAFFNTLTTGSVSSKIISASLASIISDETGSGSLVFSTGASMTNLNLLAGTTSVAPMVFASTGVTITTPLQGALEYDSRAFYLTTNTSASSKGIIPITLFTSNTGTTSLANVITAQGIFPAGASAVTLAPNVTYEMEGWMLVQTPSAAVSHTVSLGFAITGTLTSIGYMASVGSTASSAVTLSTASSLWVASNAATVITPAASGVSFRNILIRGIVRSGNTGTFIPQVTFSASPGIPTIAPNGYLKLVPLGVDTVLAPPAWHS